MHKKRHQSMAYYYKDEMLENECRTVSNVVVVAVAVAVAAGWEV